MDSAPWLINRLLAMLLVIGVVDFVGDLLSRIVHNGPGTD